MKSGKQRRAELKARRIQRAVRSTIDCFAPVPVLLMGAVAADPEQLRHNNTYGQFPLFYVDRAFSCRDCNQAQLWTAKQQKWWYEVVHGHIDSRAVRCLACRRARRERLRNAPPGASLLREQTDRLRALGDAKPTASAVAEIEAALESKWWSLRVVAIQTMARWGGEANLAKLHELMAARPEGGRRYFAWERVAADAARSALLNRERWP